MTEELSSLGQQAAIEAAHAGTIHPPFPTYHHAYAVILEELDEVWDIVKLKDDQRDKAKLRRELLQVAGAALRTIVDLKL